jgi:hypothetical protein
MFQFDDENRQREHQLFLDHVELMIQKHGLKYVEETVGFGVCSTYYKREPEVHCTPLEEFLSQ